MIQIYKNNFETLSFDENQQFEVVDIFDGSQGKKEIIISPGSKGQYLLVAKDADFEVTISTAGIHVDAKIFVILDSRNHQKVSGRVQTNVLHSQSRLDQYMLSLLKDKADVSVDGIINIGPGIVQAEGYLLEENLFLGEQAKIKTLPMLDVRSDDVKASHGARIDTVDQEKLFYMSSKGISKKDAQNLIVQGYINNVLDQFDLSEEEREKIVKFLE